MVLLWLGIKPRTKADQEKLGRGLQLLMAGDPSLAVKTAADGTVLIGAESEERLDAAIEQLVHTSDVEGEITGFEIAYKEALTREAFGEATHARQSGGRGHYGHVQIA